MSWKKYFTPVPTGDNPRGNYSPQVVVEGAVAMQGPHVQTIVLICQMFT